MNVGKLLELLLPKTMNKKLTQWHFFMMGLLIAFIIFTANYK